MKILFVCKSNFARSQMAEALYNKLTNSQDAESAGLSVEKEWEGKKISQFKNYVVDSMNEIGIDLSENKPKQLTKEMFEQAEKVVIMEDDRELWPEYLFNSDKVTFWDIPDTRGKDLDFHNKVRDKIKEKVLELIN